MLHSSWCLLLVCVIGAVYSRVQFKRAAVVATGNGCLESAPWPCKTPGKCLSFDFICDGEPDCPDSYDEDPELCTAKNRPAPEVLENFISKYRNWLVPRFLGEGTNRQLATQLIESKTIKEYATAMKLTQEQEQDLYKLMESVKNGQQIEMILLGMPVNAWNEAYILLGRITASGFIDV